jgi:hypothetical protein
MSETAKTYLKCSAKEYKFTSGGSVLNVGVRVDEIIAFAKEHGNERGYLNLTVSQRKEVGQYGQTHSVYLDAYDAKKSEREKVVIPDPDTTDDPINW